MWWLIPVGIVAVGAFIYDRIEDDEREARSNWESKRSELKKTVQNSYRETSAHIQRRQNEYNFYALIQTHHASVGVANEAYRLLKDAKNSLNAINKILKKSKIEKEKSIDLLQTTTKKSEIIDIKKHITLINQMRRELFDDKERLEKEKNEFYDELKKLNNQTRALKEKIFQECGHKGRDWYLRLESRKW